MIQNYTVIIKFYDINLWKNVGESLIGTKNDIFHI